MGHSLKDLDVYQAALEICDISWDLYQEIPGRYYLTSGQFISAADSIGANIAEGYGRGTFKDRKHFLAIARGSLYETSFWLHQLLKRKLISASKADRLENLLVRESTLIMGYSRYLTSKIP